MIPRRLLSSPIERLRDVGSRNVYGEYAVTTGVTMLQAHRQPLRLEDIPEAGGQRLRERLILWLDGADQLLAAQADGLADRVRIGPLTYTVLQSESWQRRTRSYTRAVLLRET